MLFLKINSVILIEISPVIKEVITPKTVGITGISALTTSGIAKTVPPKIIGTDIKNAKSTASFLSTLKIREANVVDAEREIPGKVANPWNTPAPNAESKVGFCSPLFITSDNTKNSAVMEKPIGKNCTVNVLFMLSLKIIAKIAAGSDAIISKKSLLKGGFNSSISFFLYYKHTEKRDPKCKNKSNSGN